MNISRFVSVLRYLSIALLVLGIWLWATPTSDSAQAAIVQLEDSAHQLVYRSQHRLVDRFGHTWQAIFFKQVQSDQPDQPVQVSLRLVGLPGAATVNHPYPLLITTPAGQTLPAADVFLDEAPAPTIAQYDMQDLVPQLSGETLRLTLPVIDQAAIDLEVPAAIVQEWLDLLDR